MSGSDNYRILFYIDSSELREMCKHMVKRQGGTSSYVFMNTAREFYLRAEVEKFDAIVFNASGNELFTEQKLEQEFKRFVESKGYKGDKGDTAIFIQSPIVMEDYATEYPSEVIRTDEMQTSKLLADIKANLAQKASQRSVA